jgi:hypothetical protein
MITYNELFEVHDRKGFKSLFSRQTFARNQVLCPLPATKIHNHANMYTVQVGRYKHVEVDFLSSMNHSCNPAVVLDTTRMLVIAARVIQPGDEITFFYPSTEWEMAAPFICNCGSPNCIHVVAGARYLSPAVLERYFLNQHIRRSITGLLTRASMRYRPVMQAAGA